MATPNQSQALYEMSQILNEDWWAGFVFEVHAHMVTFGYWGRSLTGPWRPNLVGYMVDVQLFGQDSLLKNLRIAILKEAVGLGPQRYCVFVNQTSIASLSYFCLLSH